MTLHSHRYLRILNLIVKCLNREKCAAQTVNSYRILFGTHKRQRLLWELRRRLENYVEMDLKDTGCDFFKSGGLLW